MTDNAAGMTVRAGCYFKFGMSIPLAKVPFLRHFGGDKGSAGGGGGGRGGGRSGRQEAGAGDRSDGRGGGNAGGGGDDVVKASWN